MTRIQRNETDNRSFTGKLDQVATDIPAGVGEHQYARAQKLYDKSRRLIEVGEYDKALGMLHCGASNDVLLNAKGVCLLRMGRFESAIRLYRGMVMEAGRVWMRQDQPVIYRVNFCTALLLGGHSGGCLSGLCEIEEKNHPSVVRLRDAVKKWRANMTWWQRLTWWFGSEPSQPIRLDFLPGELADGIDPISPPPQTPEAGEPNRAA